MSPSGDFRVTVSMPFHGCPALLRRAVDSVLRQTHAGLKLVVVNDGDRPPWRLLDDIDDPRLVRFDLPVNRGCYFSHAVVLGATSAPWFAVHDADDWSEPQRIEVLLRRLRSGSAAAAVSSTVRHEEGKPGFLEAFHFMERPLGPQLRHRIGHHGLFRREALQALGGYFGGFRIGYDTLLMNFLLMTGEVAWVKKPLYHRQIHHGSLTRSPETGFASPARRRAAEELGWMYAEVFSAYTRSLRGELGPGELCAAIRQTVRRRVSPREEAALERETGRLAEALSERSDARRALVRKRRPARPRRPALGIALLSGGRLPLLRRMVQALRAQSPGLLEDGFVAALCNRQAPRTEAYLASLPFVDERLPPVRAPLPVGSAASRLLETLARQDVGAILFLEDHWFLETDGPEWLERSRSILEDYRSIGQVRLRRAREGDLWTDAEGRPIRWERRREFLMAGSVPYTFEPSLIRACDIPRLFPGNTEDEVRQRFQASGLATAQLLPGAFCQTPRSR